MKYLFIILVFTLSLFSKNICLTTLVENITGENTPYKNGYYVNLNQLDKIDYASSLLKNISLKPYDEDSLIKLIEIINKDYLIYNGSAYKDQEGIFDSSETAKLSDFDRALLGDSYSDQIESNELKKIKSTVLKAKRAFDPYKKNVDVWVAVRNSAFWIGSKKGKSITANFLKKGTNYNGVINKLFSAKYINYNMLNNIGYFKTSRGAISFLNEISNDQKIDKLYWILFNMNNGDFSLKLFDNRYLNTVKKNIEEILLVCESEKELVKLKRHINNSFILELFVYSKIYPEYSSRLKELAYFYNKNALFELMEYKFYLKNENYKMAAKHYMAFTQIEGIKPYMLRTSIFLFNFVSNIMYRESDYSSSWIYSRESIRNSFLISLKNQNDRDILLSSKKTFRKSTDKLLKEAVRNHDKDLSSFLFKESDYWIRKMF